MVKHSLLIYGTLLFAVAQNSFAQVNDFEGMLFTQGDYVRIRSCDLKDDYTLLPKNETGYEAVAEIISARKNISENTPVYAGLKGNLEGGNFLISGINFIKAGESCYVPLVESLAREVIFSEDNPTDN